MPSTFTTRNRLEKQGVGENSNTWGTLLNVLIDLVDAMGDGMVSFTGNKTLTTANGTSDEARCRYLNITGGTTTTVTIPNLEKVYIVRNAGSGSATITTGSGTTATVTAGSVGLVVCEGGNVCRNLLSGVLSLTATGTGNVVHSASPTFTGTVAGAAFNFTGNCVMGDAAGDAHTLNGLVTLAGNAPCFTINNSDGNSSIIAVQTSGSLRARWGADATYGFIVKDTSDNQRFNVTTGATPTLLMNTVQIATTRQTGWAAATNTKARTTFDTTTVTLPNLAARVGALIDDLITHGLIGA